MTPPAIPDLLYSEVEEDLRAAVRDVLADHCPPGAVLGRIETDEPYDPALWRLLAVGLGLAGLLVPEELGGQGAGAREAAVVLEELGGAVAPVPFLGSAVLATAALLGCGVADEAVAALLGRLAAGGTGTLAVALSTAPGDGFPTGVRADAEGRLTGAVGAVADAVGAEVLVVPAVGPAGPGLYEVAAAEVTIARPVSFDLTRPVADLRFDGAAGRLLACPDPAAAVERALLTGAGLLASEQVGVAQWCLDETVRYLGRRHQFGRVVGSFQALKHRLADVWLEVVSARAAARNAAGALADWAAQGDAARAEAVIAVAVAQAYVAPAAVHAAEEAVQLHGGIGMTWEHPAHLYLKRAKADEIALGTPGRHRRYLAEAVGLPGPQ